MVHIPGIIKQSFGRSNQTPWLGPTFSPCSPHHGSFSPSLVHLAHWQQPINREWAASVLWLGHSSSVFSVDSLRSNTVASEFTQARVTSCGLAFPSGAARQKDRSPVEVAMVGMCVVGALQCPSVFRSNNACIRLSAATQATSWAKSKKQTK